MYNGYVVKRLNWKALYLKHVVHCQFILVFENYYWNLLGFQLVISDVRNDHVTTEPQSMPIFFNWFLLETLDVVNSKLSMNHW